MPAPSGQRAARPEELPVHRLTELERKVAEQEELLAGAASFLHQAAYLAHYHQPGLEREIRAFLAEIKQ